MIPALLPCPFCGGEAVFEEIRCAHGPDAIRWSVGCVSTESGERCHGYQSLSTYPRRTDAANAWNTRKAQSKPVQGIPFADLATAFKLREEASERTPCKGTCLNPHVCEVRGCIKEQSPDRATEAVTAPHSEGKT